MSLRPLRTSVVGVGDAAPFGAAEQWGLAAAGGLIAALLALGLIAVPKRLEVVLLPAAILLVVALAVRDLRRVLLVVALLDLPLGFDVNVGYSTSVANLGGISGFNLSLTTGALIVLYAMWIGELLTRREKTRWRGRFDLCIPPMLYLAAVVLSLAVAQDRILSVEELFMLVQIFLLYLYIVSTIRTEGETLLLVFALLVGLVFESLFILAQRYLGAGFHLPGITNRIDPGLAASGFSTRLGGTLGSPNTAGSYLALLLPVALAVLIAPLGRRYKLVAAAGFLLGVAALVHTLSRGGWIAFSISAVLVCVIAIRRRWLSPVIPITVVGLLTMVMLISTLPFQHAVLTRLTGNDYGSAHSRIDLAHMAENVIRDHPLFGVGANNYSVALPHYETARFATAWHYTVHDKYLLVWAETGIIGLVTFLIFLVSTVGRGARAIGQRDRVQAVLALGLTAGVVGQFAHMAVDLFHNRAQVESLWLASALITVLWLSARREDEEQA